MVIVINGRRLELRHEINAVIVPALAERLTAQVAKAA